MAVTLGANTEVPRSDSEEAWFGVIVEFKTRELSTPLPGYRDARMQAAVYAYLTGRLALFTLPKLVGKEALWLGYT